MCDWHLEPERAYKITYKERDRVLVLHVLANNEEEARAITRDVVNEIIKIEEMEGNPRSSCAYSSNALSQI